MTLALVLGLVQIGRLSCFMGDASLRWGSTYPPVEEAVKHMCMAAYFQAADLARQGDANVYAAHHYPVYDVEPSGRSTGTETRVRNLGQYIEDPYEYPPQFVLLPRLALALAVLGTAPFVAFFEYHLPRIATGEAFAFFTKVDLDLATNYGSAYESVSPRQSSVRGPAHPRRRASAGPGVMNERHGS